MGKYLNYSSIPSILKEQQEVVHIVDSYIKTVTSGESIVNAFSKTPEDIDSFLRDFAVLNIFSNIRNGYQDSIFIIRGLMDNKPYYLSPSLAHAHRFAQDCLIDLAYIVRDIKNRRGHEHLRYLKFMVDTDAKEKGRNDLSDEKYNRFFPTHLDLKPRSNSQWSPVGRPDRIGQGLKFYKLEPCNLSDHRHDLHKYLSSDAHGNTAAFGTLISSDEENLPRLESYIALCFGSLENIMSQSLDCYIRLYLGRVNDFNEISRKTGYKSRYLN